MIAILLSFFFFFFFFPISLAIDSITPSQALSNGEILVSANGIYFLGFFNPPKTTNLYIGIWYGKLPIQTIVWVANRRNPILELNSTFSISAYGSLQITSHGTIMPLWFTPSVPDSDANPIAQLLDTGNFVVKSPNYRSYLWQSFDYPTDTMLPGMKIGSNLKTGIDRNLTAWRNPSDPSPGNYTWAIDLAGVPQIVIRDASGNWNWRGGPWNGFGFSGAGPYQFLSADIYRMVTLSYTSTPEEVYYYFNTTGEALIVMKIHQNGTTMSMQWQSSSQEWDSNWLAPSDDCDLYQRCGINSVCDIRTTPICRCLEGFDPSNRASWDRGDWSDGCVRSVPLGCEVNKTDEFKIIVGAKMPDTTSAVKNMSLGLDECKTRCLMNCRCRAYANADLNAGGSGCVYWTADVRDLRVFTNGGQNLFVRVASNHDGGSKRIKWAIIITIVSFLSCLMLILICIFIRRRWKSKASFLNGDDEIMRELEAGEEGSSNISFFHFTQLMSATNNFSNDNKLGEGGFGPVYKGKLSDGQDVAIKRLSTKSKQGLEEFKNEVLLIAKLQHRNLVRLLGCCIYREEKLLIYEFMPNKSLDLFLFNSEQGLKLEWKKRFQIIEGISQGLLYLHKHSRLRVIHRDLKASNILLDAELNPKISDFGMARIFDANDAPENTRRIVGTYGYMPPEYAFEGLFSIKSDIFSFGVLLLEIVSGKRNAGFREVGTSSNLLAHAWNLWKKGECMELVDPMLDSQYRYDEVARSIYVALLCVQDCPEDRPIMSDVATMLGNESLSFSNIKQPAFFTAAHSSFNSLANASYNGLSVSATEGR